MIHLDTSFLVDLIRETRRGVDGPALTWLNSNAQEQLAISTPVLCELMVGAALHAVPEEEKKRVRRVCGGLPVVAVDEQVPDVYADFAAKLIQQGTSLATMDLLIASVAAVAGAALLTRNARHFERIPGLRVITY